jgi:homoserine dehydrogenase
MLLVLVLTACGWSIGGPSHQLVERAIVLQLQQTQAALNQQLRLDIQPTDFAIKRVIITEQTPVTIEGLHAFRVQGTYNATTTLPTRQVKEQKAPFDVYLQRQREGKTWRLARLQADENGESIWVTQRLQ